MAYCDPGTVSRPSNASTPRPSRAGSDTQTDRSGGRQSLSPSAAMATSSPAGATWGPRCCSPLPATVPLLASDAQGCARTGPPAVPHACGSSFRKDGMHGTLKRLAVFAQESYARAPALRPLAGQSALVAVDVEDVMDTPAGRRSDALVDGQGLAQQCHALFVVAVLQVALADSSQSHRLLQAGANIAGGGQECKSSRRPSRDRPGALLTQAAWQVRLMVRPHLTPRDSAARLPRRSGRPGSQGSTAAHEETCHQQDCAQETEQKFCAD